MYRFKNTCIHNYAKFKTCAEIIKKELQLLSGIIESYKKTNVYDSLSTEEGGMRRTMEDIDKKIAYYSTHSTSDYETLVKGMEDSYFYFKKYVLQKLKAYHERCTFKTSTWQFEAVHEAWRIVMLYTQSLRFERNGEWKEYRDAWVDHMKEQEPEWVKRYEGGRKLADGKMGSLHNVLPSEVFKAVSDSHDKYEEHIYMDRNV